MAITAITNNMCIIEPALYTKNPNTQNITKITATRYNKFPIISKF